MLVAMSASNPASAQAIVHDKTYQASDMFLVVVHGMEAAGEDLVKVEEMRSTLRSMFGDRLVGQSFLKKSFIIELPMEQIPHLSAEVANIHKYFPQAETNTVTYSYVKEDLTNKK